MLRRRLKQPKYSSQRAATSDTELAKAQARAQELEEELAASTTEERMLRTALQEVEAKAAALALDLAANKTEIEAARSTIASGKDTIQRLVWLLSSCDSIAIAALGGRVQATCRTLAVS
jgi:hypothetical protein